MCSQSRDGLPRSKDATKRERFLAEMEAEVSWQTFLELLPPTAPAKATEGVYLRIHWPPF
jgi:hypothetical protein